MAMNHRKLFPSNQTLDCSDFYNCYPYSDYNFVPPPPPLPPPKSTSHVTPYVIIIVVTLIAAFFLLLGYYVIFVKNCLRNCFQAPQTSDGGDEEFLDENHGPTIDHPIWYITTIGLQPSVISSITVIKYNKGDGLVEGSDCSVCLNEFQEDQTLRLLPKCNHAFHIPCIDTWLSSHTNCPLCRAAIVPTTANNPPVDSNEATQIIISEADQELITNQNRGETEDGFEFPGVEVEVEKKDFENSKKDLGSNGDVGLWVVEVSDNNYVGMEDGRQIQRVRRSFSLDLRLIESERRSVNPRVDVENISDATKREFMEVGSSVLESLQKRPVSMKRSLSYGERPFLSRNYRNPKPILPL